MGDSDVAPSSKNQKSASAQAEYNSAGTPISLHGIFPIPCYPVLNLMHTCGVRSLPGISSIFSLRYAISNGNLEASVASAGDTVSEDKSVEGKERNCERCLGHLSLFIDNEKENGHERISRAAANGVVTESDGSRNEALSKFSKGWMSILKRATFTFYKVSGKPGCSKDSTRVETVNGSATCISMSGYVRTQNVTVSSQSVGMLTSPPHISAGPATNLNIGLVFWAGHVASPVPSFCSCLAAGSSTPAIIPSKAVATRDRPPLELWSQDARELKKQSRKQSNRESSRHSRLRRQTECEKLALRVETMTKENCSLKEELEHVHDKCKEMAAENASLSERLEKADLDSKGNDQ